MPYNQVIDALIYFGEGDAATATLTSVNTACPSTLVE